MKTMQKVQRGFTLIELMIVVAIIGILAALAIPAYQDYTIKSRVGEGASLTGAFKTAMEIYWSENGTLLGLSDGVNASTLGLASVAGEYVSNVAINSTGPVIEVDLNTSTKLGTASATCFTYTPARPANTGGNLQWSVATGCTDLGGANIPAKYLPKT